MDFSAVIAQLNWLAVLAAALSTFVIGGIWYSVFEKSWMNANGFSKEYLAGRKMPLVFGLAFLLSFIMAFNLGMFIGPQGSAFGTTAGFMTGFGWVAMAMGIVSLFEKRTLKYVLINGGYMVVAFTTMGTILGAWK